MNYFEFYGLPVAFDVDTAKLRKLFYQKSRELHPDFYTMAGEEKQEEVLQLASINNKAFKVLGDKDLCMKYVLELTGTWKEGEKQELPQAFLMEMMDINEAIMELEFEPDAAKMESLRGEIKTMITQMEKEAQSAITAFDEGDRDEKKLALIKDFYLKKRYLNRLQEKV